jgi:hypothetical protein
MQSCPPPRERGRAGTSPLPTLAQVSKKRRSPGATSSVWWLVPPPPPSHPMSLVQRCSPRRRAQAGEWMDTAALGCLAMYRRNRNNIFIDNHPDSHAAVSGGDGDGSQDDGGIKPPSAAGVGRKMLKQALTTDPCLRRTPILLLLLTWTFQSSCGNNCNTPH